MVKTLGGLLEKEEAETLPLTFLTAERVENLNVINPAQQKLGMEIDTWDTSTSNPDTR